MYIGGQSTTKRNDYHQVDIDPIYSTPEPVYSRLDHNMQPDPDHYNVTSTVYETTPQYSTVDDAICNNVVVKDGAGQKVQL